MRHRNIRQSPLRPRDTGRRPSHVSITVKVSARDYSLKAGFMGGKKGTIASAQQQLATDKKIYRSIAIEIGGHRGHRAT